jgi:hypothetical protein
MRELASIEEGGDGGTIPCNWVQKPLKHFTASPTKKMLQIYREATKTLLFHYFLYKTSPFP